MAKPFTESVDYVYQWLDDTNRISENLGDPVNVYTLDGDYTAHNAAFPSYLINTGSYTHDINEQNAVVRALNNLNDRKVQRSGDIITGNFRINQNLIVDQDLVVDGGDIISSAASFNLLINPTSVSAFLAATSVSIGAATGATTINHSLLVKGGAAQTFIIDDGTTTKFSIDSTNGNTLAEGTLTVNGATGTFAGDVAVNGGDITTTAGTFNLINVNATTVNFAQDGVAITMGALTGTTTIRNNASVNGGTLGSTAASFNLLNTPATISAFAAGTAISIGAATGTTTVNHDLSVNGGDLVTNQLTFNLLNTTATTVNAFGAATAINIGAATGTTAVNNSLIVKGGTAQTFIVNDGTTTKFSVDSVNGNTLISGTLGVTGATTLSSTLAVTGNSTLTGDLAVNGGDITTTAATFNLVNATATTVNFAGASTALTIGATTGTATIRNANTVVTGDLAVNGGDLTTSAITFNLLNSGTLATVNAFTSATAISIGAATGSTTINNSLVVAGGTAQSFIINDGTTTKFSVDSVNGNTLISGTLGVTGATTLTGDLTLTGDIAVNGGDAITTATTFNMFNTTATTVNALGAVLNLNIGHVATNGQTVNMFTASTGNSTYNFATGATLSGNTKTLNFGTGGVAGSFTDLNIGSTQGGTIVFNTPNMRFAGVTVNGVIHTTGGTGTVGILGTATANQVLLSGASAAPTWSTLTLPSTISANSFLFAKSANIVENTQFISSDSTVAFDYSIAGKVNLTTTGQMPTSILVIGDLRVGSNKSGTYSQTGTSTITVNIVGHGMITGNWVYLDFTSGTAVDGAYQVTVTGADTFTVQGSIQTTSGNVTAEIGGTGNITKVLTIGADVYDANTALFVKSYDLTQVTNLVKVQDALGNDKLIVDPTGKTTINGDLYVQGNIVNTGSSGAVVTQGIVENPVTTTSTVETTILTISAATYRSVEFQIQAVEGTKFWTSKILAIHDGTNVNWTEYGMAGIGTSPVSAYAIDIVAGNLVLKVTSASAASTVYKVVATAILA